MTSELPKLPSLCQPGRPTSAKDSTDELLQNHYVQMQKSLMTAVDKELDEMNYRLREATEDLKRTEDDKTVVGVALYQANTKIGRMNSQLENL